MLLKRRSLESQRFHPIRCLQQNVIVLNRFLNHQYVHMLVLHIKHENSNSFEHMFQLQYVHMLVLLIKHENSNSFEYMFQLFLQSTLFFTSDLTNIYKTINYKFV